MGDFTTQSRRIEPLYNSFRGVNRYGQAVAKNEILVDGSQTTYSYRSSGVADGMLANNQLAEFRSSNWLQYSPHDKGHPFSTVKKTASASHPSVRLQKGSIWYVGPVVPNPYWFANDPYPLVPGVDLNFLGTRAINRTIPTHPASSISQTVTELIRDGIPTAPLAAVHALMNPSDLREMAFRALTGAGKDYLNASFAWVPFMNDVVKIFEAVAKTPVILEQLARDSGRQVRRRYKFEKETSASVLQEAQGATPRGFVNLGVEFYTGDFGEYISRPSVSETTYRRAWFSGAYMYFFENPEGMIEKARYYARSADAILGTTLTAEVLWELAPWSWLADWQWNFGEMISNSNRLSQDGLVLRYGYLMVHDIVRRVISQPTIGLFDRNLGTASVVTTTESKRRFRATPYGFSQNPDSWNPRQWAILAALGLTKADRVAF